MEWVLANLRRAQTLDPANERIRQNLAVAEARQQAKSPTAGDGWVIDGPTSGEYAIGAAYTSLRRAPDPFVERSDAGLAALLQPT